MQDVFDENFEDFELVKVEVSERPQRNGLVTVWYEFDGTTADGKAVDVEVDAAATTYLVEPD